MNVIDRSFQALTLRNSGGQKDIVEKDEDEGGKDVIDLTSQPDLEQRYAEVMTNTFKIITSKDAQIETLEHYLSVKEMAITRLEKMNTQLVGKVDD